MSNYGTASITAYPTEAAATPRPIPELEQVVSSLSDLIERFSRTGGRMEAALDRLHGGKPRGVDNSKSTQDGPPSNALSSIHSQLQAFNRLDSNFTDIASRLDSII